MLKRLKSKRLKIIVSMISVALILFAVVSIAWVIFYHSYVKPLEESICSYTEGLPTISLLGSGVTEWCTIDEGWNNSTLYDYHNYNKFASHTLEVPDFLNFRIWIQSITPHYSEIDPETNRIIQVSDYTYYFSHYRDFFRNDYSFRIDDYTGSKSEYENDTYISSGPTASYVITIDKDMNFISGDKALYDEHYVELKKLYDEVMEIFGEDAFK